MKTVAFDVDGTLIDAFDNWNYDVVDLARDHFERGNVIWIWSMGGIEHARTWTQRFRLAHTIPVARAVDKVLIHLDEEFDYPDIAVDDDAYDIGVLRAAGVQVVEVTNGTF